MARSNSEAKPPGGFIQRVVRSPLRFASILGVLIGLGFYIYYAVLFYGSHVTIAHNYAAELDAKAAAAVPGGRLTDDLRAWPVIKRLQKQLRSPEPALGPWPHLVAGSQGWNEALAVLAAHPGILDELRSAAARPAMGYFISGDENPDDPASTGVAGTKNIFLVACLMPYLGCARNDARWLAFDTDVAIQENDPVRAAADVRASLSLARLCDERGQLIEELVRIAITAMVAGNVTDLLADHPGFLSDAQLREIAAGIKAAVGPDDKALTLDTERLCMLDYTQRLFTDDGHGDGYLCREGYDFLMAMAGNSVGVLDRIAAPTLVERFGTRRQYVETFDRLTRPFLPENRKPLWASPLVDPAIVEANRIDNDKSLKPAQRLPAILIPALGKAFNSGEQQLQIRDGVLVAIALERYRLAKGVYPDTLDALIPAYLDRIPPDRFDGKPLKYRLADGRAVLYSIGADLKDDGGTPMRKPSGEIVRFDMHRENPMLGDWILFPQVRDSATDGHDPSPKR